MEKQSSRNLNVSPEGANEGLCQATEGSTA